MKRLVTSLLLSFAALVMVHGQEAVVLAEVTRDLEKYKTLDYAYELKEGEEPFEVKAWFDQEVFRRIRASQKGDGGVLTRDFYYDANGDLRYAIASLGGGEKPGLVEERFEFVDGALSIYTGANKKPIAKGTKEFASMETALLAMSGDLVERIEGSTAYVGMIGGVDAPKTAAGTIFGGGYSDGVFSATEKGDYLHLDLEQADGEIMTFFVLKPDATLMELLADENAAKGKKIRVHWTEKMQEIPEAGGATRLKICERLELLK